MESKQQRSWNPCPFEGASTFRCSQPELEIRSAAEVQLGILGSFSVSPLLLCAVARQRGALASFRGQQLGSNLKPAAQRGIGAGAGDSDVLGCIYRCETQQFPAPRCEAARINCTSVKLTDSSISSLHSCQRLMPVLPTLEVFFCLKLKQQNQSKILAPGKPGISSVFF